MPATAQVSIYPLRQPRLSLAIEQALEVFRGYDLEVAAGTMSSVVWGDDDVLFRAIGEAFQRVSGHGEVVMVVTISNACPIPGT